MTFDGIPEAAFDFYDDLEVDNSRTFWAEHHQTYEDAVRTPVVELAKALESEFGAAKVFRPQRDVRFSKDKTPYKTRQGVFVQAATATGYYLQVSAAGVMTGFGWYHAEPDALRALRAGIDSADGAELDAMIADLTSRGWTLDGDEVRTAPRGYSPDHPRIALLRHKSLRLTQSYGFAPFVRSPELVERVRKDWQAGQPVVDWISGHLGS